jgi:molybdopterin-guanine dinucleotide biosynthesis protein A
LTTDAQAEITEAVAEPQVERLHVIDESVTGIVLAGGQSSRMGQDKAWVELAGRPLALWVLDALRAVTDDQIVVAREAGRLETLGAPVVIDRFSARGPLSGIHAGLKAAQSDLCLVVACDMPLARPTLLAHVAASVGPAHAAVPYLGDCGLPDLSSGSSGAARDAGLQPLLAAYRRRCIQPLEKLLLSGSFPTSALISVLKARIVGPDEWRLADPDARSFFNINTYEDLIEAARLLAG